jgi:hypothetical protein
MNEFAEFALRYAKLGLSVFPLPPKAKIPQIKGWNVAGTTDPAQLELWWRQQPNANVAIQTGPKSKCFVLDVDPQYGGTDTLDGLLTRNGPLPRTWQQMTGGAYGGFQIFFRYPNFRIGNKQQWDKYPGLDVRGDGGYVVAPPSIHPDTGNAYSWDGLKEIEDEPLADAPIWLLEMLRDEPAPDYLQPSKQSVAVADKIPSGTRHKTLVALAGRMRRMGLTETEILPTLRVFNQRCEPQKPDAALVQIAGSMMLYQPGDMELAKTANALWRERRALELQREQVEHIQAEKDAKLRIEAADGLTVYRTPANEDPALIENLLYPGLTIFAGSPKSGKSWYALQMALAVANGSTFMRPDDVKRPGRVVYVALEESASRTAKRMKLLQPSESIYLQNISMIYTLLPLMGGGAEQLEQLVQQQSPSLLIIDTFLAVVGNAGQKRDVLRSEYAEMNVLHKLSERHALPLLVIHHKRKNNGMGKGLESVSGSTGLTAAADAVWTIDREDDGISSISIVGRDIEDQTLAVKFDQGESFGWSLIGTGDVVKSMKEEKEIYTALKEEGAQTAGKLAIFLRLNVNRVREILYDMNRRGLVARGTDGKYFASSQEQGRSWQND